MENREIIRGLKKLAAERRTLFLEDGDNEQFLRDYMVLIAAKEVILAIEISHKVIRTVCDWEEEQLKEEKTNKEATT